MLECVCFFYIRVHLSKYNLFAFILIVYVYGGWERLQLLVKYWDIIVNILHNYNLLFCFFFNSFIVKICGNFPLLRLTYSTL